jgi:chemotaxis protein histidine kinase CheA
MDKAGTNTGNYTQTDAYQGGALSYDKNTDYSALLNKYGNPSSPDYSLSAAAYYEAKRNAKIRGEGLQDKYGYTTNFTSAAPGTASTFWNSTLSGNNGDTGDAYYERNPSIINGGSGGGGLTATSQADYINSMYDANQNSALAKLKSAYDTNNQTLDATAAKIPKTYYNSENQLAASNDQQRQNFNEYAAANGLNNGAGGQAQLAYSNQYQKSYTSLEQAKADALAQVEQQRASLATKYQNDIAQAVADNDISRAQALYQEAIRVDNSVVSWAQQQATWAYQEQQAQEERAYEAQQTAAANATKQQERIAETMAGIGDYSGYKALGYSDSQINALTAAYKAAVAAKTAKSSGSGSGSKSGSGSRGYSYTPTNGWSAVDAYVSRGGDAADYIGANYKALGYKSKSQAVSAYNVYSTNKAYNTKVENSTIPTKLKSGMAKNLYAMATDKTRDKSLIATRISTAYNAGAITEAEADFLLKKIGG